MSKLLPIFQGLMKNQKFKKRQIVNALILLCKYNNFTNYPKRNHINDWI